MNFANLRRVLAPPIRLCLETFPPLRSIALDILEAKIISKSNNRRSVFKYRGFNFHINPRDFGVSFELATTGSYEPTSLDLILKRLKPGDTVIDIGAHVGIYSLPMSEAVGPEGKIISFEPNPNNAKLLNWNIDANDCKNIKVEEQALRHKPSVSDLLISGINTGDHRFHGNGYVKTVPVMCTTLDNYLDPKTKVDAIKMDIQGGEGEAFYGMARVLTENPDIFILWELSPEQLSNAKTEPIEVLDFLTKLGFKQSVIDDASGSIEEYSTSESLLDNCPKRSYINILSQR